MGIKFKQIDNLQSTFDDLSGDFQSQIQENASGVSGIYNDSQVLSGWKYFDNNVNISGAQGLLVSNDNIYTQNSLIASGVKIGFSIATPRNSTPGPEGSLQVSGGQIYFEEQLNVRNNSDIIIENGNLNANQGIFSNNLTISGQSVTTGEIQEYVAGSGLNLTGNSFSTSSTGHFDAIGIGTGDPRSILDINSTDSAPIMPRMNTAQMNAIASPVEGMLIYNTDSGRFAGYTGSWSLLH